MAAPSNTVWGDIVKDYDRVGISISQSYTDTQCTVTAEVWFWTKYSFTDSSYNLYFDFNSTSATTSQSKETSKIETKNDSGSGWNTSNQVRLGTYSKTFDRTADGFTQNCAVKINGLSNTSSDVIATTTYSVLALPKLTLTLNKTEGVKSFTGSGQYSYGATVPTTITADEGYHLVKLVATSWDGKTTDTNTSIAGQKEHTAEFYMIVDRTATAYAERDTYTVSYNANGGSGVPNNQTKTYGIDLTLSSIIPTREGYKFLGWATSSTATTATYSAGGTFTTNANTTLYAVWERLGNVRYNDNGTWKRGIIWKNDNGVWKRGLAWKKINGTWKQGV